MFFRCFFCTVRLSIFERFVFPKGSKFNRLVWDSLEIWKCGLYFSISAQKLPFLRQTLYITARKVQRTDNSKNINISLFFLKKFDHAINNRHTGSTFA